MPPPIPKDVEKQLHALYYSGNFWGRDRLFALCVAKGIKVSRRQLREQLKK